ncbi:tetratricopeptide (TPR) repeat protein [Filimonas zeae]|uniref:Tetratricopeptide repeat protein n=1 Tax=Filimonas zeae TaxID=1737353 RepID=A0A917J599_9BACT|nr:tetratricopeptide repeat protein [Filimonas zeae]MDR6342320.1 tetratricopeptide (TPR) repeat protein [Filimonas zeae]GGH80860.1 hypothetical protein GCM10011379_52360 [Filimonas zeae]
MMKRTLIALVFAATGFTAMAQEGDSKSLHATGKEFMRKGDYDNAVMVLNRAAEQEPRNADIRKDLAFTYYLKKDYANAIATGKKVVDAFDDETGYQTLGLSYKAIAEYTECEKLYKKGLKKFPKSGVLYNEFGELYAMQHKLDQAIPYWEKGIEVDPNISTNYYNAARYYDEKDDLLWSVIYGEMFLNIESLSPRTIIMKNIVKDNYKLLFMKPGLLNTYIAKGTPFTRAIAETFNKYGDVTTEGVTAASLTVLRTRFITDWYKQYATQFPYRLFDHQRQLLQEGTFDAYNQWLFTAPASPDAYQTWVKAHEEENNNFLKLQSNRVFKVPEGQYYPH